MNLKDANSRAAKLFAAILKEEPSLEFLESSQDGLTPEVLAELVKLLRQTAQAPAELLLARHALKGRRPVYEVCGTGGSKSHRLNTSTLTALFAPRLGLAVVKHGGRSASGKKGSMDLLEALGLDLNNLYERSGESLRAHQLAFLGAALTYTPFGRYAPLRKQYGKPSLFNLLGPLLSPAMPDNRLLGCYSDEVGELLSATLLALREDGVVLIGSDKHGPIDEIHPRGSTQIWQVRDGNVRRSNLPPVREPEIDRHHLFNDGIAAAGELLDGAKTARGELALEFVLANLSALNVLDQGMDLDPGDYVAEFELNWSRASLLIESARELVTQLQQIRSHHPRSPLAQEHAHATQWAGHLAASSLAPNTLDRFGNQPLMIAEVKFKKPQWDAYPQRMSLEERVQAYNAGAGALSVITHPMFGGSIEGLRKVKTLTQKPILAKDFLHDEQGVDALAAAGADGILLIADWLGLDRTRVLARYCVAKGCVPVVESTILSPETLDCGVPFLPLLNARNLFTLKMGHDYRNTLARYSQHSVIASGLDSWLDVRLALAGNCGALVGHALMRLDTVHAIEDFLQKSQNRKPLLKACGALSSHEVTEALSAGADLVGINLIPSSRRMFPLAKLTELLQDHAHALDQICILTNRETSVQLVELLKGVPDLSHQIQNLSEQCYDFPLLRRVSANEENPGARILLPLKRSQGGVSYGQSKLAHSAGLILDGPVPGSGNAEEFPPCPAELRSTPIFLAGGITTENVANKWVEARKQGWNPVGIDAASGVARENGLHLDPERIAMMRKCLDALPAVNGKGSLP